MKSHVLLLARVLEDTSARCCVSTTKDLKRILSRVEGEGFSFLTITLPTFAKDLERALDQGYVDSTLFRGFRNDGSLPKLFRGLTSLIFNPKTGVLLDEPSIDAIQCIRQACYLLQKLERPCSDARMNAAFDQFIECEQSVRAGFRPYDSPERETFRRVSQLMFGPMLSRLDRKVYEGSIVPKHGPGATADRLRANRKFENRTWTDRLERVFPAGEYLYTNWRHYFDDIEDGVGPNWLDPGAETPVRVIAVPKTQKTPRIIAIEPAYNQYVQQGLLECLVEELERLDNLSSHFIGIQDQQPNRDMACHGSLTGDLATLDLSEASDRVSYQHVEDLLGYYDWLFTGVDACRSFKADVPGYGVVHLAKFASMGSALTFPIEAMVFATIVMIGIEKSLNTQLTLKDLNNLVGQVRVYGDDIIVPTHYALSVVDALETYGLVVNRAKSFWTGMFRESCGGDFYAGHDVKVVRCREEIPTLRKHASEIESTVHLRNHFYKLGYWRTVEYLDHVIERVIPFPRVQDTSPGLGKLDYLGYDVERSCPHLQRPLVRAAVVDAPSPVSRLDDRAALLKFFLKRGDKPLDEKHLERAGRPLSVNIKTRWVPPY